MKNQDTMQELTFEQVEEVSGGNALWRFIARNIITKMGDGELPPGFGDDFCPNPDLPAP
ncbi:hypothetical protein [Rheinheimera sp. MMS21-TC3]|uniref:hypothetical protein n=1 Tax=Rheinheimera sp. MMS21-TC3 TaxID=3072790 RepID=UPI0028C3B49B|nr:hypothetical protein [Rheinheimera sp. MMS21-TC3]WNO59764.1 hypothetical protein RDV63_02040 [Rheinheimera sp. MMS21-TC3]